MTTTGSNASAPSLDGTGTDRNATASLHQPAVPAHRRSVMPWVWLCAMILTLLCGMAIKVLFVDSGEGISISGATIFWDSDLSGNSFLNLTVTESQVNSVLVILFIFFLCRFLTAGMSVRPGGARQIVAEWLERRRSVYYGWTILPMLYALALSDSRAAWLACAVGVAYVLWPKWGKRVRWGIFILICLVGAGLFFY